MGTSAGTLQQGLFSRDTSADMKVVLIFSCLLLLSSASPQPFRIIQQLFSSNSTLNPAQFLINSGLNPCGAGVTPTTCTCPDGTRFTPGQGGGLRVCGFSGHPTCSCPDGSSFTPGLGAFLGRLFGGNNNSG